MYILDPNLKPYATDKQWAVLEALAEHGSESRAAAALGCAKSLVGRQRRALEKKAAQHGYAPDHDMRHPVAPGFLVKGTSTLYDMQTGDARLQWVKTTADAEAREQAIREAVEGFKDEIPRASPVAAPKKNTTDLMTVYPIGDHHFGMLAWGEETGGDDYDTTIAEGLLRSAVDYLVSAAPPSEDAAILVLGDFLHYDGFAAITPSNKNLLDSDTRFPKMVRAAIRALRYSVARALGKHGRVRLIIEIGNHDIASSIFLMETFGALYENEPRVTVDTSPRQFHCFTFGKNLIATHHGHSVKMDKLPLLIATDWPQEWGRTVHRFIHTGHVHHDAAKEYVGAMVESHGILAPLDAYAANAGYRARKTMKAIILHSEHGEQGRTMVSPGMLK